MHRDSFTFTRTVLNGIEMVRGLYIREALRKTTMARITPIDVIRGFSWVTPVISQICCNSTFVNQNVRMQWEMPPKFLPSESHFFTDKDGDGEKMQRREQRKTHNMDMLFLIVNFA